VECSQIKVWLKRFFAAGFLVLVVLSAGCFKDAASLDRKEENHPLMKKAREQKDGGQYDEAIASYQEALRQKPDMIRAHLELGVLYETHKENYVLAIYHYNYYLEARPDTNKRQLLLDSIRHAEQKFIAGFPLRPDLEQTLSQLQEQNKKLYQESMLLKHQVAELNVELSKWAKPVEVVPLVRDDSTRTREVELGGAAATENVPQKTTTYTVKKGDTLMRISSVVYGNPRGWVKILEANKSVLPRADKLSVGMELTIPH
jgi:tetratricopeptide (TPR) repeat protein